MFMREFFSKIFTLLIFIVAIDLSTRPQAIKRTKIEMIIKTRLKNTVEYVTVSAA